MHSVRGKNRNLKEVRATQKDEEPDFIEEFATVVMIGRIANPLFGILPTNVIDEVANTYKRNARKNIQSEGVTEQDGDSDLIEKKVQGVKKINVRRIRGTEYGAKAV